MVDPITNKRLGFIKYLFKQGIEQLNRPDPLRSVALFSFHDSVELFLQLTSEFLNIGVERPNFMDYWNLISEKLRDNQQLPQKESMRRLNKARVSLKHHGTFPSKLDLDSYFVTTKSFFEEATQLVFNLNFAEISLANYVQPEIAKQSVLDAEEQIKEGKINEAIDNLAIAYYQILNDYEKTESDRFIHSPFSFGESMHFLKSFGVRSDRNNPPLGKNFSDFVDKVTKSIDELQKAIKIIALGIDYRRYVKFNLLVPLIHQTINGKYHIVRNNWYPKYEATKEDAEYCFDFIIEISIALQEFDYRP